jgi:hypothetical protein
MNTSAVPSVKTAARRPRLPISRADYERISRITTSVVMAAGRKPHASCQFYAVAGAAILRRHYNIAAIPVAGAAFFLVDHPHVLSFGLPRGESFVSTPGAFHCWVEADGYAVDFMAPVFPEAVAALGIQASVPRLMFQRPLSKMKASPFRFAENGDFWLLENVSLAARLAPFYDSKQYQHLVDACLDWYRPLPNRYQSSSATQLPMAKSFKRSWRH